MGVNLVGSPVYGTTEAAALIAGSCNYLLLLEHNNSGACGNYNAVDTIFSVAYNNNAQNNNGIYTAIGFSSNGTDGQHHRGFIKATRDIISTNASTAGRLTFGTRNITGGYSEVMHLNSFQNVGIGTCTPSSTLHLRDNTNGFVGLRLEGNGTYGGSDFIIYASALSPNGADDFLGFYNNSATDGATEGYKLRLFKSGVANFVGNIGVGTTTPQVALDIRGSSEGLHIYRDAGNAPDIRMSTSNGTITSPTAVTNGQLAGQIHFQTYDGSNYLSRTAIFSQVCGSSSTGNVPVDMVFYAGSTARTERMRIKSNGYIGIGTAAPCAVLSVTTAGGSYTAPDTTNASNIYVFNSNSSCTTAHSILTLRTNNAGGGNPFISFDVNDVTGWAMGVDNADSDKFKLGWGWSSVSANTALTVATSTLRVGIGTESPTSRLDVCGADGKIQSRVDNSDGSTINVRPNAGKCGWISYTEDAVADRWGIGVKNGDAKLYFASGNVSSGGGTTRMALDCIGNLGIGTSSPVTTLMIKGGASSTKTDLLSISTCSGAGAQPTMRFDTIESNSNILGRISTCDNGVFSSIMIFETSGCKVNGDCTTIERMRIVGCTGNIGVGTIAPTYRLEVNGSFYSAGSSCEYKTQICQYNTDSCMFMKLKPVTYQYKDEWCHLGKELKSGTQIGLIAEDTAEVFPELAILKDEDEQKVVRNVDYEKLSIILLSEVQKLRKEVDNLKNNK